MLLPRPALPSLNFFLSRLRLPAPRAWTEYLQQLYHWAADNNALLELSCCMRRHPPVVKCKPLLKANATSTAMMSAVIAGLIVCFIRKKPAFSGLIKTSQLLMYDNRVDRFSRSLKGYGRSCECSNTFSIHAPKKVISSESHTPFILVTTVWMMR